MIKYLYSIKNLFPSFVKPIKEQEKSTYIGSIEFLLKKSNDIDIICSIPDIDINNIDNMSELAEKYAWFLLNITDGLLVDNIIKQLKKHNANNNKEDVTNKLFIENILFFWHILFQENQKKIYKQLSSNDPLIKPSSVFSVKGGL